MGECDPPVVVPTAAPAVDISPPDANSATRAADAAAGGTATRAGVAGGSPAVVAVGGVPDATAAPVADPGRGMRGRGVRHGRVAGGWGSSPFVDSLAVLGGAKDSHHADGGAALGASAAAAAAPTGRGRWAVPAGYATAPTGGAAARGGGGGGAGGGRGGGGSGRVWPAVYWRSPHVGPPAAFLATRPRSRPRAVNNV